LLNEADRERRGRLALATRQGARTMNLPQELAWALRRVARRPASAAGIVITLTLGIAISVGMFSVLNGVVLRALPYPDAERIAVLHGENVEQNVPRASLTAAEAAEIVAGVPGFEHTAVYAWGGLVFESEPRRPVTTMFVSSNFFSVFGVPPLLGRTFVEADFTEQRPVIVLTHAAWIDLTGGDPAAIGRALPFENGALEVIGVLPASFAYLRQARAYRPLPPATLNPRNSWYLTSRYLPAVARLADGVSSTVADQGLAARLAALRAEHGLADQGWRLRHMPLIDDVVGNVREVLYALFAVALLVLLIACATAACLVSIRLDQRQAELAVRRTLGATHARVAFEVTIELASLATLAAVGGVLLANLIVELVRPLAAGSLPRTDAIAIDGATLLFGAGAAIGSIVLAGIAPLVRALHRTPLHGLRIGASREVHGGRRTALLPAVGVGLAATATVLALALAMSLMRLGQVEPGFRTENIAAFQVFQNDAMPETPQFVERALPELRAAPGVRDAVAVSATPSYVVGSVDADVEVPGSDSREPLKGRMLSASPRYHDFLRIPIVKGRGIEDRDTAVAPAAVVVNEALARRAFGGADPIGRELVITVIGERKSYEVVGVAADTRNAGLRAPTEPELVVSVFQQPFQAITLLVDFDPTIAGSMRTLEQAVERARPLRPTNRSFLLSDDIEAQLRQPRFFAAATGWFAALALALGAAGVNAVVAALQRRRTREIGLRLALGAAPRNAAALIVGNALRMIALGLAIGALLGAPALRWLEGALFGVGAGAYWGLFGVTALVLILAGLLAAGWPAWRAARTAPIEALRYE
jgi:putative ABC transport system permease protein